MKKIVVVDDDPDMRQLITDILGARYEVCTAEDGLQGLELIRKEKPDLVVLDLLMPRMHGFEVCRKIREDPTLKGTRVLISSSKSYVNDVKTAGSAGADSYIIKPYDASALAAKVEELLGAAKAKGTGLELQFWGTRGSIASPGPKTQRYGGNTPCTTLRYEDQLLIIDSGTGIRELGNALLAEHQGKPVSAHLFIGHTHWDHIQGFPFFTPFYMPQNSFKIYGSHGTTQTFEDILAGQMNSTYFPVQLKDMSSRMDVIQLTGPVQIGGMKVSWHYLNHPGITIGFRFETKDRVVCYISDHEPYAKLNARGEFSAKEDEAIARFVEGSDLLISEAQYTEEEYKYKKSWGHSTFGDVITLAVRAQVKNLALFHHDPMRTDEMMDHYVEECRRFVSSSAAKLHCFGAQEGMKVSL